MTTYTDEKLASNDWHAHDYCLPARNVKLGTYRFDDGTEQTTVSCSCGGWFFSPSDDEIRDL